MQQVTRAGGGCMQQVTRTGQWQVTHVGGGCMQEWRSGECAACDTVGAVCSRGHARAGAVCSR